MAAMSDTMKRIADKVAGAAKEHGANQDEVGRILGISRASVSERYRAKVPFLSTELHALAVEWREPITRFYPSTSPALDAPSPGVERGAFSASAAAAGVAAEPSSAA